MVTVINKKTKQQHTFSDADWELAKQKQLHTRYKVVEQTAQLNKKEVKTFTPPELKKENKKKGEKKNIAG